jgi:predicted AAA+ superfamily ATPase
MHYRKRHITHVLSKRSKIFPVVGLVGPRQVGKSTTLITDWKAKTKANYITLDKLENVNRAKVAPENFLLTESSNLATRLIIDEIQKVPTLFDSIKAIIYQKRRVGAFTISGSVEFSDKTGVKESLAGRMGLCRLYPLNLSELTHKTLNTTWVTAFKSVRNTTKIKDVEMWLERGGMPIFCALHDQVERNIAINSWLEALCYRDIQQLKFSKLEGEVALQILNYLAIYPDISLVELAKKIGINRSSVPKYISALEALFILYKIPVYKSRVARAEYHLFDPALLHYFTSDKSEIFRYEALKILCINEIYSQFEYSLKPKPNICTYKTPGGAKVELVVTLNNKLFGINLSLTDNIKPYDLRGLKSFLNKYQKAEGIILAPVTQKFEIDKGITVLPWSMIG